MGCSAFVDDGYLGAKGPEPSQPSKRGTNAALVSEGRKTTCWADRLESRLPNGTFYLFRAPNSARRHNAFKPSARFVRIDGHAEIRQEPVPYEAALPRKHGLLMQAGFDGEEFLGS